MDAREMEAVVKAVNQRLGGRLMVCGTCGGTRWTVVPGFIVEPLRSTLNLDSVSGQRVPLAMLCCEVCGLTQTYNLKLLVGFEESASVAGDEPAGLDPRVDKGTEILERGFDEQEE